MGMGEPLLNFDNVLPAVELMMDDLGYGISKRKVTVSTAGVVPGVEKLIEHTDVSLAISLHAPNDELPLCLRCRHGSLHFRSFFSSFE